MSFLNDINVCKEMVMEEEFEKSCSIEYEGTEFMVLPKYEQIEESLVNSLINIVGEEIVVDTNVDVKQEILEKSDQNVMHTVNDPNIYYEECLDASANVTVEYEDPCSSSIMDKEDWQDDSDKHTYVVSDMFETAAQYKSDENILNDHDGDEETIATFVTAAGQQLALYAVEDSDEIFAVAVYDESGEPPTNFQFLMKADVERLIGEGAVRTVKKPTQIKKQLLTAESPLFFSKDTVEELPEDNCVDKTVIEKNQTEQDHGEWEKNEHLSEQADMEIETTPKILYTTANKQSDITYLMVDDPVTIGDQCEDTQEEVESDNDIIEQSTVQYILLEGDQSDSELTFDEIQATLQNLKSTEPRSLSKKPGSTNSSQKNDDRNSMMIVSTSPNQFIDVKQRSCTMDSSNMEYVQNTNCTVSNYALNASFVRKRNCTDRQTLLNVLDDSVPSTTDPKTNLVDASLERSLPQSGQTVLRTKRSRKQQLTSVNRDDSEIIIQPASLLNEEENNVRKRGKRRKRLIPHSTYHRRNTDNRKMRKIKRKEVEVIEIDVDEEENTRRANGEVVEITIDDNKDKCSSDKENEIIMVGDSDDETREVDSKLSTSLLRCEHCSRNFRQQRALDTHLRVCSKSPVNSLKINAQNQLEDKTIKKQYACKICQEKFDVVVALARHVRSLHSQRKKRRPSKSSVEEDSEESSPAESTQDQIPMLNRTRKKKNQNSWEVKKLNCVDCGRWFPSAALLNAHCLQHGTKRSEKQIRRCQICKKLIKSRVLFIRHLKMHSKSNKQTTSSSVLEKKTTRQVTRKLTTLRKRGRPRKF